MNRDEWLAARMRGVGGSDCAPALGQSPLKTQLELYLEKTGQLDAQNLDEVERVRFGQLMEAPIASEYARREGVKLRRRNQIIAHPRHDWMIASVDRVIEGQRKGVEVKNVDGFAFRKDEWGEPGSDQVPDAYLLQCAHYMAVLDYPEWHLAACIGGNRLVKYVILRDAQLEEMIIDGEHEFWRRVQDRDAPQPDYSHATTANLFRRIYPGTDGSTIELDADIEHWHKVREDAEHHKKLYEAASDAARAHIAHAMGSAAVGHLPHGGEYRRKVVNRKGYSVDACEYVDLRFAHPKKA